MSEKELWTYFRAKAVRKTRLLDRDLLWVKKADFDLVSDSFKKEFNILHRGKSARSKSLIFHIHAIEQGEHVVLHRDTGNIARFFPLGVIHLVADVLPQVTYARVVKRIPMKKMFSHPELERELVQ